nr:class I SAM-dependent methyltransferase [Micromonospora sp. DSM 115978]
MSYPDPATLFASTERDYLRYRPVHPPALIDQITGLSPAGTVLDLGCGPGSVAVALAERGRDVIGLDANPQMLDVAVEAAGQHMRRGKLQWRLGDAHDLSSLPRVAGATIGDAFHWFDRARVLRELDLLVAPGGFVAVIVSFAANTSKPWWYPLVDRVISRHLGPERHAGPVQMYRPPVGGDHEAVLRASAFDQLTVIRTDHAWSLTLDEVVGHQYTQAYSSPDLLGSRLDAFDRDLRAALRAAEPAGRFTATTQPALIIARREGDS